MLLLGTKQNNLLWGLLSSHNLSTEVKLCAKHEKENKLDYIIFNNTSAVPVGNMYSYRKVGGKVAFSWMAK